MYKIKINHDRIEIIKMYTIKCIMKKKLTPICILKNKLISFTSSKVFTKYT